jgi:small-conductance mechanosensitive channel
MKGDVEAAIAELDALQKSEDDAEYDEGDESDEDGDEGEGTMDKSLESEMGEEAQEFLDVSNFLTGLFKSLNNLIKEQSQDIKNLRKSLKSVEGRLEKSLHNQGVIAKALTNQDTLLKSIGDQPLPREAKLSKSERFEPQKPEVPGRDEIKKALPEMKKAGLISIQEAASAEESLNKSLPMSTRVAAKVAEYFGGKK